MKKKVKKRVRVRAWLSRPKGMTHYYILAPRETDTEFSCDAVWLCANHFNQYMPRRLHLKAGDKPIPFDPR